MLPCHQLCRAARVKRFSITATRWSSTASLAQRLSEPVQSYISTSQDPYLNLSIEHHISQKSSPEAAILFLYVNRPSIIIGRNQNPWLEVDLALIARNQGLPETIKNIDLVRRRSGGGTVFHDEGNVNWTVICPSATFTRDKHAEMVVRALRGCGIERARVNERHDIVLDQGGRKIDSDPADTHMTPYTHSNESTPRPLKVSGSAYKLTRGRALHHGTCLLSSPNLKFISQCLRSRAKPFIKARGVESVSSPVTNINLSNERFIAAVQLHFGGMYANGTQMDPVQVDGQMLDILEIRKGYEELKSLDWTYLQTPQFTLSNSSDTSRPVDIDLTVRHGVVIEASIASHSQTHPTQAFSAANEAFVGLTLHEVGHWADRLDGPLETALPQEGRRYALEWLQKMLPNLSLASKT